MSDWCILRTSGRHTLPLADSLTAGGFEAWTPAEMVRVSRRKGSALAPILPTWVFVPERYFDDMLGLELRHPLFALYREFRQDGNRYFPFVADDALNELRREDYRWPKPVEQPKPKARRYEPGEAVTIPDGAWTGMSGIVERTKGKFVIVTVDRKEIKVASWKLDEGYRQAA